MIKPVFSIYDAKTGFGPIYTQHTKGEAERQFLNTLNEESNSNFYKHPEDFDLYQVGEWDYEEGKLLDMSTNVKIISGLQCKEMRQQ